MTLPPELFKNPQLKGEPFYWPGGRVGVLLVHGFTATTAEVRPFAELLHAAGYTIAAPLLPGHNAAPEDMNQYRWQDWYATVEAMYNRLAADCQTVIVGGESTGGVLALLLASRRPEVAAVLAYAPALRLTLTPFDRLRVYAASPFLPYVAKRSADDDLPWQGYMVLPLKAVLQLLALQRYTRQQLAQITQPVFVAQGRLDDTVHPDVPATIARAVSSEVTAVHWLENSHHVVILDHEMPLVAELTLAFLKNQGLAAR